MKAIKNSAIWILVAPAIVTAIGLVFAVLTERIRWAVAFKTVVFMPMAISLFATGVIWHVMYIKDPSQGAVNAGVGAIRSWFVSPGALSNALAVDVDADRLAAEGLRPHEADRRGQRRAARADGDPADRPLGVGEAGRRARRRSPARSKESSGATSSRAAASSASPSRASSASPACTSTCSTPPARRCGGATTGDDGAFEFDDVKGAGYKVSIDKSTFAAPFGGVSWLGSKLITPSIIIAYIWVWAGFAMVVIGAGLAAISREVLEAARTDGATEWQVFRRITVPMLAPVLSVVFITMLINVLKVFDIVISIAPGSTQSDASVIAVQMWRQSFGGVNDFGVGSAIAVFLFVLVDPGPAPQRAAIQEGGLMATYEAEAPPIVIKDPSEALAAQDRPRSSQGCRSTSSCSFIGVLWLMPTLGLFLESLLSPADAQSNGWWKVIAHPHLATWANYSNVWHGTDIPTSLRITAEIAIGGTLLADHHRRARGLRVRVDRVPGPRLAVRRRDRAARRAAADGADPDLHALQQGAPLRHDPRPDPVPHRVRTAVRDLPAAKLLHRDTEGHPRVGAHRRRVRDPHLPAS